ncbi:hypothetical protein [Streptomyces fungicidicus]|uniref:Uncharacterized protein n=1 Tax=Streptomyces fungicidicus TaxID=68203 RepID=A0A494V048_9ACTN|nr:hypothetical protein [Streptomyces fungicidicus]AYL33980.1 hypothetical protein CNQ36_00100 [Streptomyces fungicidicus]AYL40463.1 hypothetical protein CNQ36_34345 [Streptomyces fungicidicus]
MADEEAVTSRIAPWYDASAMMPGDYLHPRDPTRFITVDAGLQPIERDCPEDRNSPNNRMVWDDELKKCRPYNESKDAHLFAEDD